MNDVLCIYDFLLSDGVPTWIKVTSIWAVGGVFLTVVVVFELIRMRLHRSSRFTKKRVLVLGFTGVVMFAFVSLLSLQLTKSLVEWNPDVYEWLVDQDYTITDGVVNSMATAPKFWASDPVPTFRVADIVFEYGTFGDNYNLNISERGGVIEDGLSVQVWHRDGFILRIYRNDIVHVRASILFAAIAHFLEKYPPEGPVYLGIGPFGETGGLSDPSWELMRRCSDSGLEVLPISALTPEDAAGSGRVAICHATVVSEDLQSGIARIDVGVRYGALAGGTIGIGVVRESGNWKVDTRPGRESSRFE